MKYFILLLLCSCSIISVRPAAKQCSLPVFIASKNLQQNQQERTNSAIKHWNESVGINVFFDLGDVAWAEIEQNQGFVLISISENLRSSALATTNIIINSKKCIQSAKIYINSNYSNYNIDVFETIIRHELGHVLGFYHTSDFTKLMYSNIENSVQHPVDVSEEEIRELRQNMLSL